MECNANPDLIEKENLLMRISDLFTRTSKSASKGDVSRNAQLLLKAGYIQQLMAGVYSYLPLGMRVLNKIENIIREEMEQIGAQEILMPALQPREIWDQTGRWEKVDVLFKLKGQGDRDLALGPTHEEVVTPLMSQYIQSYRDLPKSVYQIQTKFRNEPRAKSGLLRGREFRMKDMYSFHGDQESLDLFYEKAISAYKKIYDRCGIGGITLLTYASGGIFSKYSHEFQTVTDSGEDIIYRIPGTDIAINKEIIDDEDVLEELLSKADISRKDLEEVKAIEVGNIFKLGTRFSAAFSQKFVDENGDAHPTIMGCYGMGPSRVMGAIAECLGDEKGLAWPEEVAPFRVHLVSLARNEAEVARSDSLYQQFNAHRVEVLYDDRLNVRAGEKFSDADLIGLPFRVVISKKTLESESVELKGRMDESAQLVPIRNLPEALKIK